MDINVIIQCVATCTVGLIFMAGLTVKVFKESGK